MNCQPRKTAKKNRTAVNNNTLHCHLEFFNSAKPADLPSYKFLSKVGTPVMLLANVNLPRSDKGTVVRTTALHKTVSAATVL